VTLKSTIRLLTIDLDDTLWPCMPTIMHAENTSYQWLQQNLPKITQRYSIDELRDKRRRLMQQQPALFNDLSEARRVHFRELADELGYDHDWIEQGFQVFLQARQQVTFYDDTLPVLQRLQRDYSLVALTNGNAHILHVGLADYFALQISAADVAAAKPDPAMFLEAMKRLGVSPEQTLHVGDHAIHDIYGAKAAGIRSVWVNRRGQAWQQPAFRADYEVADLNGLLELLL
jgi:putative hydrolase of the HAD superfamily